MHILSQNTNTIEHWQSKLRNSAASLNGKAWDGRNSIAPNSPVLICIRKYILNPTISVITVLLHKIPFSGMTSK